jgi:hypothetical protein
MLNEAKIGSRVFFETGFAHDWCLPCIGTVENVSYDADGNVALLFVVAVDSFTKEAKRVACDAKAIVSVL